MDLDPSVKFSCRHAAPPQDAPPRQDEDKDVHLRDNIGNCDRGDRTPDQEQDHLVTLNVKDEEHDDPADKKLRHHVKPDHDEVINYNLLY